MAEAAPSIQQSPTIRITTAAVVLAQLQARRAIKQQLQRQGVKVAHLAAREITALASEYLAAHREELMPSAIEMIERWTAEGVFGKRAQRSQAQRLSTFVQPFHIKPKRTQWRLCIAANIVGE